MVQVEILPQPPTSRTGENPWPAPARTLKTSSSHEEGAQRLWAVSARALEGREGRVEKVKAVRLDWSDPAAPREIPGSEMEIPAGLVVIAAGYTGPEQGPLAEGLGLSGDDRGGFAAGEDFATTLGGVFAAGDCVRGASLVVNAIDQGRRAAAAINAFLTG